MITLIENFATQIVVTNDVPPPAQIIGFPQGVEFINNTELVSRVFSTAIVPISFYRSDDMASSTLIVINNTSTGFPQPTQVLQQFVAGGVSQPTVGNEPQWIAGSNASYYSGLLVILQQNVVFTNITNANVMAPLLGTADQVDTWLLVADLVSNFESNLNDNTTNPFVLPPPSLGLAASGIANYKVQVRQNKYCQKICEFDTNLLVSVVGQMPAGLFLKGKTITGTPTFPVPQLTKFLIGEFQMSITFEPVMFPVILGN